MGMHLSLPAAEVQVVKTDNIEGVIVGARTAEKWGIIELKVEGFWTPTPQDIAGAEGRLRSALEKGVKDPASVMPGPFSAISRQRSSEEIGRVLERYGTYRRQYFGVVIARKHYLFLNSFPAREQMREKEGYVRVMDGGAGFWRILYSVEDGVFSQLSVNGYG